MTTSQPRQAGGRKALRSIRQEPLHMSRRSPPLEAARSWGIPSLLVVLPSHNSLTLPSHSEQPRVLSRSHQTVPRAYVSDDAGQIGVFGRDPTSGDLALRSTVHLPGWPNGIGNSYLAIDATGQFLYLISNSTDQVFAYLIDPQSGTLTELSGSPYSTPGESQATAIGIIQEKNP